MVEPWIEPAWKFGAYFGAGWGTFVGLMGGALGCCSFFVARGQGKRWILGAMALMAAAGGVMMLVGTYAYLAGQPYAIWYPFLFGGFTPAVVFGSLYPMIAAKYREAEHRRIDAEAIKNS
ncbi:hypothetical protein [Botrimarina hoheduenensis]|uniref:Uncharacterized protein n=1 Tax=Botrimarina hoheduenensis TaxID=2528000 RepID=A0A5C5W860_9BACT|nr:hypothetical protein [Botrimarina hoheduenensis]TWT46637.1 hypothetical protein Pla111_17380 [Botrimarina hoheduenensis]